MGNDEPFHLYFHKAIFQFGHHNMFRDDLSKASIIDSYPSLPYGRILNFKWNEFVRKIKKRLRHNRWKRKTFKILENWDQPTVKMVMEYL